MYFAQHYLDCLSQASYLIGDTTSGRAVLVDPRRDIDDYLRDAEEQGLRIVGVINTHFHADFLAGHLEVAAATGAWIGYGTAAQADYEVRHLADGERIALGDEEGVTLEVMHTPGHTPESISVLVREHGTDEVPYGVLTGDALFIGDVGRPDLLASIGFSAEELGTMLHDTIQHRLMGLPDEVRVFPGHGAGSACGKNLSTEKQSTIGDERRTNYACQPMDRDAFVAMVTEGQPSAPEYFLHDAVLNRKHHDTFSSAPLAALSWAGARDAAGDGAILLDTRDAEEFNAGHVRGSVSVPLDGRFAETAGMLLSPDDAVVLVGDDPQCREAHTRLGRIGFDGVVGALHDVEQVLVDDDAHVGHGSRLTAPALARLLDADAPVTVVDVRNVGELDAGAIPGSVHVPLAELRRRVDEVPRDRPLVVTCAGGWRSSVAASYLRSQGFTDVSDLLGGFTAWQLLATTDA
ncbi:MBL fold metallo-hydrolase [Nocardioides sp. J2M5]|uniref:MBL fold metallo-hydrolase n=1 Tax=Nocardioides palaemonis TaxID=2829810 RepID=UPI001BAB5E13|nr:MBL fold metallo-hydrolase [Nocardioides palaemonis]MBS2938446.1 MBL fold metallo-hydrolase [Nocardioides palaemonis]